jgi:hypothetical protein
MMVAMKRRGRAVRTAGLAAGLALLLPLGACTSAAPQNATAASFERQGSGSEEALLQGELVFRDGCLLVEVGGQSVIPAFPAGEFAWDGQNLDYGEGRYAPGDAVRFGGGGGGSEPGTPRNQRKDLFVPEGCPADARIFYVQS